MSRCLLSDFELRTDTVRPAHQYGVAVISCKQFSVKIESEESRESAITGNHSGTECPMHQSRQSTHGFGVDVEVYASVFIGGGHSAELGSKSREAGYFLAEKNNFGRYDWFRNPNAQRTSPHIMTFLSVMV